MNAEPSADLRRYELLLRAGRRFNQVVELEALLLAIRDIVCEAVGANSATLLWLSSNGRRLHRLMDENEVVADLRAGAFPGDAWRARQLTNGTIVRLERPDGTAETVRAIDVDPGSGALVIESLLGERPARAIAVGEIRHLRLAEV